MSEQTTAPTERDELADLLMSDKLHESAYYGRAYALAEADLVLAAGYRKPRTITTVEDLGTVYAGAILIDAIGEQWGVYGGEDRLFLVADGWEETYDDNDIPLPATVVWEPTNA